MPQKKKTTKKLQLCLQFIKMNQFAVINYYYYNIITFIIIIFIIMFWPMKIKINKTYVL